jgi:signal transduction histidine kinase
VRREHAEALAVENARLYEQAQQAVRGRDHILAIVSHDLKNPLGTIMMAAGVLSRGKPLHELTRPELDAAVGRIRRSAERMLRLIEDLLDFASIEVGKFAIKRQPCAPGSMIDETLASFDGVAQQKKQRLTAEVARDLPEVYCDHDRILQVLSNLVGNASKATPEGGAITLRAEMRGDEVVFVVSDNGPGISEADIAHLFERYWRSGEAEYKGSGLGLAIARGIVVAHGGKIWVESALGLGATFLFTVPVVGTATGPDGAT